MTKQITLLIASLFGMTAIILGAFGAHALKKILDTATLNSFETGVKYQIYHALVLLFIGVYFDFSMGLQKNIAWFFVLGTVLFSFSIYGLTLSKAFGKSAKFLGPITPIGGSLLIIGWGLLAYYVVKNK